MIKLLKYDWKRNSTLIVSTLAVLVVVQLTLTLVGQMNNWTDVAVFVLNILGYFAAAIILFINSCKTYHDNITSFSRRLLPLHPLSGVFATAVLNWLVITVVGVIAVIHAFIYLTYNDVDIAAIISSIPYNTGTLILFAAYHVFLHFSFVIFILTSITVARSFRMKRTAWIGIIFFFAIATIMLWLDYLLFGDRTAVAGTESIEVMKINELGITIDSSFLPEVIIGPFISEAVFTVGFLLLITYLLNKKVEL